MLMYLLMFLCAIGMIWGNTQYKKKGVVWGRPVAGIFGALALLLALCKIGYDASGCKGKGMQKEIQEKEMVYAAAQMQVLGEYLGNTYSGESALLLVAPVTEWSKKRHEAMVDALKEGLDGRVNLVIQEHKPQMPGDVGAPGPAAEIMPEEFYLTAEAFEKIMTDHQSNKLIITTLGLPFDYQEMKFWTQEKSDERQKLVLINSDIFELKRAFEADFIAAAVISNPSFRYEMDAPAPTDYREAFDDRYLLVHPDNLDEIAGKYPNLFKSEDADDKK